MQANLTLSYYVWDASWTSSYDLRLSKEAAGMELKHHASVLQNTGVDWKDVQLTLSTGNPNESNVKPVLQPFYLDYNMPVVAYNQYRGNDFQRKASGVLSDVAVVPSPNAGVRDSVMTDRDGVADYTERTDNMLREEYEIKLKYSILSDNQPHNVVIQSKALEATYTYSVVPKLDLDAFLMARVTDWESLHLVPGKARIYFDGSYSGETMINPHNASDTLQINLGRDKNIVVTRVKLRDKSKEKILSDQRFTTKAYEITVRNTRALPIRIVIEDQVPVTKQPDIKIENLDQGTAEYSPGSGKLLWDFTLKPKENKRLVFGYEVRSPKDKVLNGY